MAVLISVNPCGGGSSQTTQTKTQFPVGAIIGIVIGTFALVLVFVCIAGIVGVIIALIIKRQRNQTLNATQNQMDLL